jgi:hypothetical protein
MVCGMTTAAEYLARIESERLDRQTKRVVEIKIALLIAVIGIVAIFGIYAIT